MKNGEFNNRDLLNTIYQTFDFDKQIISDLKYVKNEISKLDIKPNKIQEDNIYIRKAYRKLSEENEELSRQNKELTCELSEIKASRLWKLKSKF